MPFSRMLCANIFNKQIQHNNSKTIFPFGWILNTQFSVIRFKHTHTQTLVHFPFSRKKDNFSLGNINYGTIIMKRKKVENGWTVLEWVERDHRAVTTTSTINHFIYRIGSLTILIEFSGFDYWVAMNFFLCSWVQGRKNNHSKTKRRRIRAHCFVSKHKGRIAPWIAQRVNKPWRAYRPSKQTSKKTGFCDDKLKYCFCFILSLIVLLLYSNLHSTTRTLFRQNCQFRCSGPDQGRRTSTRTRLSAEPKKIEEEQNQSKQLSPNCPWPMLWNVSIIKGTSWTQKQKWKKNRFRFSSIIQTKQNKQNQADSNTWSTIFWKSVLNYWKGIHHFFESWIERVPFQGRCLPFKLDHAHYELTTATTTTASGLTGFWSLSRRWEPMNSKA